MKDEENVRMFTNLPFFQLPFYYFEGLWQNFDACFAKIASKTCVNFSISVDVKREVGGEGECFEFAHLDLFEAHVCAFEKFGDKAKHGGT